MLDIHSHILPQVDDGSTSMQMTQDMLREAKNAGLQTIIASPHFRSQRMNRRRIRHVFTEVQNEASKYSIQLLLGYEVHYSSLTHLDMFSVADFCIQGTRCILLEFSDTTRPVHWDVMVCDLIRNDYKPIIVHPERYIYIQKSPEMAIELKRYGCELQVDAMSLDNRFLLRSPEGETAHKLIQSGIVDYIASDAHRPEHYRQLGVVRKRLGKQWPENGTLNETLLQRRI